MLALAIISTIILGICIVVRFNKYDEKADIGLIISNAFSMLVFIFIIITIWVLYAR
jgi:hypothetical protein